MIETLKLLGVGEKEAHVYSVLLSLGTASVQEIAEKAALKRPSVYIYLETLLRDGFVQKIVIGKKDQYQAVSPKFLETKLEQNLKQLRKDLPHLEVLYEEARGKPNITIFEGEKGLAHVYEEMLKAKEMVFWSDLFTVEKLFPDAWRKINQATIDNRIFVREIIADTKDARSSSKRWKSTAGELYTSRLANGPIFNDNAIYGNVVTFFRLQQNNLFVVRIEDPTIAVTMTTLFDMAWRSAKPFL